MNDEESEASIRARRNWLMTERPPPVHPEKTMLPFLPTAMPPGIVTEVRTSPLAVNFMPYHLVIPENVALSLRLLFLGVDGSVVKNLFMNEDGIPGAYYSHKLNRELEPKVEWPRVRPSERMLLRAVNAGPSTIVFEGTLWGVRFV